MRLAAVARLPVPRCLRAFLRKPVPAGPVRLFREVGVRSMTCCAQTREEDFGARRSSSQACLQRVAQTSPSHIPHEIPMSVPGR